MRNDMNEIIKNSLTNAYSDLTPDRLEEIKKAPKLHVESMEDVIGECETKRFNFAPVFAGVATAAVLAIAVLMHANSSVTDTYAYIYIDVNPSIEIAVNSQGKVVYCKANNSEGEEIVNEEIVVESIKNKENLSVVVENVIKSIRDNGYFSGQYDSVLISYANVSVVGKDNMQDMMADVQSYVKERNVCNNVVCVEVSDYEAAKVKAEKYGISPGKADYVEKVASEVIYTEEELATQNIDNIVEMETGVETTSVYVTETTVEAITTLQEATSEETTMANIVAESESVSVKETVQEIVVETSSAPTAITKIVEEETTRQEKVTSAEQETTSFKMPRKTIIKVKKKEYQSGVLQIRFKKRVDWSENGIVRVTSSKGSIMDAEFAAQNAKNCIVKIKGCVPGETYTVYFEGIKRKKADKYTNYTFTFSVEE